MADFFKVYYERHSSVRKISHKEDLDKFKRHINTNNYGVNLAKLRLSDITRAQLIAHHAKMAAKAPSSKPTAKRASRP